MQVKQLNNVNKKALQNSNGLSLKFISRILKHHIKPADKYLYSKDLTIGLKLCKSF